jgi:hypothetical protein
MVGPDSINHLKNKANFYGVEIARLEIVTAIRCI